MGQPKLNNGDSSHHHGIGNERTVGIAALLTGSFMFAEVAGGLISGSLALLADAGHMVTDFASLILAWLAFRLARRPANWKLTYGFDRFSVLAAFVNGLTLFVIAVWICFEAIHRLQEPMPILGNLMLWVAAAGLAVNLIAFWVLSRGERENLNIRAAALHVVGDLLGSVAALIASIVIIIFNWTPIDPILSILVAVIILRSAWRVVRESGHILLEGAPRGFDRREVADALLAELPDLISVNHIHAWSVTQERPMITLEAEVGLAADDQTMRESIKLFLREKYGISHATVEIDRKTLNS